MQLVAGKSEVQLSSAHVDCVCLSITRWRCGWGGVKTITTCKRPNLFSDCPLMNLWLENHSAARHHHFVQINSQFVAFLHLRERERASELIYEYLSLWSMYPTASVTAACDLYCTVSNRDTTEECRADSKSMLTRWRAEAMTTRTFSLPMTSVTLSIGHDRPRGWEPPITNTTPQVSNVGYWSNMPVLTMCQADNNRNELKR